MRLSAKSRRPSTNWLWSITQTRTKAQTQRQSSGRLLRVCLISCSVHVTHCSVNVKFLLGVLLRRYSWRLIVIYIIRWTGHGMNRDLSFSAFNGVFFRPSAYETLSDTKRRQEYDQMRSNPFSREGTQGTRGGQFQQPFSFNFEDMFNDFDIFGQPTRSQRKRHFESHFQGHEEAHRSSFQNSFGGNMFNMFSDFFSFDGHSNGGGFHSSDSQQRCHTVTQRRGNMVTTYTKCSWFLLRSSLWFWC